MLSEIRQAYDIRLFDVLGNGKKRYSEIVSSLGVSDNGLLDKQLKYLISMEAIQKVFPINRPNDKKRQFYQIKDNLMRFYFTYIFRNESLISKFGEERFYRLSINESLNNLYEAKFYKKKMSFKECKNEEAQIRNIAELDCDKIGFVCSSDFNFESKDYELLNAENIYFMRAL